MHAEKRTGRMGLDGTPVLFSEAPDGEKKEEQKSRSLGPVGTDGNKHHANWKPIRWASNFEETKRLGPGVHWPKGVPTLDGFEGGGFTALATKKR